MVRRVLFGLVLIAFASAGFAQEKKDEKKPLNLLPLAKGTKWEYTATVSGKTVDSSLEVTDVTEGKKEKPPQATLTTVVAGEQAGQETYSADETGVYQHTLSGADLKTPTVAVRYPVKAGTKWSHKLDLEGMEGTLELEQLGSEEVKVPLGKYTAYPVRMAVKVGGKTLITSTSWYADGVGIVKNESRAGDLTITLELKKFTPPK